MKQINTLIFGTPDKIIWRENGK